MKTLLIIYTLVITTFSFSQQRISLDVSAKSLGLNANISYQKVIWKNFIVGGGLHFGNYGKCYINNYVAGVPFNSLESPYVGRETTLNDTSGTFYLYSYSSKNMAVGISLGLGVFKEFSIKHGIRFNLNHKFFYSHSKENMRFGNPNSGSRLMYTSHKFIGVICPELVHTIRVSGRMTFCYGLKVPYYFSLDKGKYNPKYSKDIFSGFEPELTIGFTRVIGKC